MYVHLGDSGRYRARQFKYFMTCGYTSTNVFREGECLSFAHVFFATIDWEAGKSQVKKNGPLVSGESLFSALQMLLLCCVFPEHERHVCESSLGSHKGTNPIPEGFRPHDLLTPQRFSLQ